LGAKSVGQLGLIEDGTNDDRHILQRGVGSHALQELPTIHLPHHDIDDNRLGTFPLDCGQGLGRSGGDHHPVAFSGEIAFKELQQSLVIVNQKDTCALCRAKGELYAAQVLGVGLHLQIPTLGLHKLAHRRQPGLQAAAHTFGQRQWAAQPELDQGMRPRSPWAQVNHCWLGRDQRTQSAQQGLPGEHGVRPGQEGMGRALHSQLDTCPLGQGLRRRHRAGHKRSQVHAAQRQPEAIDLPAEVIIGRRRLGLARVLPCAPKGARYCQQPLAMVALELAEADAKLRHDLLDLKAIGIAAHQDAIRPPFLVVARNAIARVQLFERIEEQGAQGLACLWAGARVARHQPC